MKELKRIKFKLDEKYLKNYKEHYKEKTFNNYSLNSINDVEVVEYIKTKYKFLKDSDGFRRGHFHLLLGRTNKGKSTLINSLVIENILNNYRVAIFLTEGSKEDFKHQIKSILEVKCREKKLSTNEAIERITAITQKDLSLDSQSSPSIWVNSVFDILRARKVDILYIDNFSTSAYGDSDPYTQTNFIKTLSIESSENKITLFGAIHQSKGVNSYKKLETNDIRSNSIFINNPSYIYSLNDLSINGTEYRILEILKSRNDFDSVGSFYNLQFRKIKKSGFYSKNPKLPSIEANKLFSLNFKPFISGRNLGQLK